MQGAEKQLESYKTCWLTNLWKFRNILSVNIFSTSSHLRAPQYGLATLRGVSSNSLCLETYPICSQWSVPTDRDRSTRSMKCLPNVSLHYRFSSFFIVPNDNHSIFQQKDSLLRNQESVTGYNSRDSLWAIL